MRKKKERKEKKKRKLRKDVSVSAQSRMQMTAEKAAIESHGLPSGPNSPDY